MQTGSPVQFRVNGMGTQTFNGTVISIGQKVDEVNRSLEVYASHQGDESAVPTGDVRHGTYPKTIICRAATAIHHA